MDDAHAMAMCCKPPAFLHQPEHICKEYEETAGLCKAGHHAAYQHFLLNLPTPVTAVADAKRHYGFNELAMTCV